MRKVFYLTVVFLITMFMFFNCGKNPSDSEAEKPGVSTTELKYIATTTARCGGNINSIGGSELTARGVCWSTNSEPNISDNKTIDESVEKGDYSNELTGLTANTTYHVRAFATNSDGTSYGNTLSFKTTDTVIDIDGNVYKTVQIGDQLWMAENLKVTRFSNGDAIPNVTSRFEWDTLTTCAYSNYDNDEGNAAIYGRLYNLCAVTDNRNIAPEGWHISTDSEWKELEMYLGMSQSEADRAGDRGTNEGGKLKETGTTHWLHINRGATNEGGFTALPAGERSHGYFQGLELYTGFWCLGVENVNQTVARFIEYDKYYISRSRPVTLNRYGFSVRCIKD
jgi:uncharacterized protein (TIGR02145 family)